MTQPENPDPSVARVAISNSKVVCSSGDLSPLTLIWYQGAGLRLEIRMSAPGLALLLTELHSSFPRSLCLRSVLVCDLSGILYMVYFMSKESSATFGPP